MDDDKKNEDLTPNTDNEEYSPPDSTGSEGEGTEEVDSQESEPSEEVFVDEPAAQPPVPAGFEQALNDQKKTGSKKSKKVLLIVLALLLIAGGAAYYFMSQKKDEPTTPVQEVDTPAPSAVNAMFYQANTKIQSYDSDTNADSTKFTVPEEAEVEAISEDGSTAIYTTVATNDDGTSEGVLSTYRINSEGEELVFKSTSTTTSFRANVAVSSDLNNIAFYGFGSEGTALGDAQIITAALDGQSKETVLVEQAENDDHGPLQPVLWSADNSAVFLGAASCYECDGPITSEVWRATVSDKKLEQVFTQPDNTTTGSVTPSPDGKSLAVKATNSYLAATYEEEKSAGFDVYTIDTSTLKSTKVYSEQKDSDDAFQNVNGWTSDSSKILISVAKIAEAADAEAEVPYSYSFDRFDVVASTGGDPSPVPVVMEGLDTQTTVVDQALGFNDTLYFSTVKYGEAVTYGLYSLPIGGGEAPINTLATDQTLVRILRGSAVQP